MKLSYSIIVLLFIRCTCFGQADAADSLRGLVQAANKAGSTEQELFYLSHLGYHFYAAARYDSALYYYYQALSGSKAASNKRLLGAALNSIGVCYSKTGFLDSSVLYYDQALKLFNELNDSTQAVQVETNLSIIYKDLGLYEKALDNSFNVLSKLEKQEPGRELASCLNTIGLVYSKIGDHENGLKYFRDGMAIRKGIGYGRGVGQSYNSLGEAFMGMNQFDSALANFNKALAVKRSVGDRNALPSTLNNIGDVLLKLNQPHKAEPYFAESLSIKRAVNDRIGQGITLNNLGKLKMEQNRLIEAQQFLDQAGLLIRQTEALEDLRTNLELKVGLYKLKKDYYAAFRASEELVVVRDSLLTAEKAKSMRSLQVRYETEKKEQQIALLEQKDLLSQAELGSKRNQVLALGLGVFLSICIGVLIYTNFRAERKSNQRIGLLMKELKHRVKNNLQILSSLLMLQSQELTDDNAIQAVRSSESRVNAMALIHKKIYTGDDDTEINIKEYITELIEYLVYSYGYAERNLKVSLDIEEMKLDVDKAVPIALIINEVVTNAFKYAYDKQTNPELRVNLTMDNKQRLLMEISDNGHGIPPGVEIESPTSFGLQMIRMFTKQLRGKLDLKLDHGTQYFINIPISH